MNKLIYIIRHYLIAIRQRLRLLRVMYLPVRELRRRENNESIVVSLTTYPKRIDTLHLTIKSLMAQSRPPEKVLLYLGDDVEDKLITKDLRHLVGKGLEIRTGYENLRSHKKYIFAMQEIENSLLVLADDDLIYPYDLIETLYKMHCVYPDCIIARRTHKISVDANGNILPYGQWVKEYFDECPIPRKSLVATTGAGSMYPPSTFDVLTSHKDVMPKLAITADDIWLKVLEAMNGILVVNAPNDCPMPICIPGTQDSTLASINNGEDENTKTFERLIEYFQLKSDSFNDNL